MGEYTIIGGQKGKDRLSVLSRTLEAKTNRFLSKHKEWKGTNCLDLGCGAGAVTFQLSDFVGEQGSVLGLDFDEIQIAHAKSVVHNPKLLNINFQAENAYGLNFHEEFEVIYSRFLLSHLDRPEEVLSCAHKALKSNGTLLL